jgi:hypothetical protein
MNESASGAARARGDTSSISFSAFVLSLTRTAAVHFSDVADPKTGTRGPLNLQGAQQMIDILGLLEEKTRGNLTAEERQLLDQVLDELRARYAQAATRA